MHKKLTITLDEQVYKGLHRVVGRRRISGFIESLVRPHVTVNQHEAAYREMAREEAREAEALEWAEATQGDVADETRQRVVGNVHRQRRRRNPERAPSRNRQ